MCQADPETEAPTVSAAPLQSSSGGEAEERRPCSCHLHERQVCDLCQGIVSGSGDGVSPSGALQSSSDFETKAKEIALLWWMKGGTLPTLASDIAAALREAAQEERKSCLKAIKDEFSTPRGEYPDRAYKGSDVLEAYYTAGHRAIAAIHARGDAK